MHEMKDYKKVIKRIESDSNFLITRLGNQSTIKITHLPTKTTRTAHPGKNAIHTIRRWLKKFGKTL